VPGLLLWQRRQAPARRPRRRARAAGGVRDHSCAGCRCPHQRVPGPLRTGRRGGRPAVAGGSPPRWSAGLVRPGRRVCAGAADGMGRRRRARHRAGAGSAGPAPDWAAASGPEVEVIRS